MTLRDTAEERIANISKDYPIQWREGFKRGRRNYWEGIPKERISFKSKYKDYWQKFAFKWGIIDGYESGLDSDLDMHGV